MCNKFLKKFLSLVNCSALTNAKLNSTQQTSWCGHAGSKQEEMGLQVADHNYFPHTKFSYPHKQGRDKYMEEYPTMETW